MFKCDSAVPSHLCTVWCRPVKGVLRSEAPGLDCNLKEMFSRHWMVMAVVPHRQGVHAV